MARKTNFTGADQTKYKDLIGAASAENTAPPKEYRFTARMPGEYGRFLNELAYQRRSTITAEIQRLVAEEMERRPEILAALDELND